MTRREDGNHGAAFLGATVLVFLFAAGRPGAGQEGTLVVPAGVECSEGSGNLSSGLCENHPNGWREQDVISASEFTGLPGPVFITRVSFRPDASVGGPRECAFEDFRCSLSTTTATPDDLDLIFANNIGPDEALVYEGTWTIATSNIPACGGTKAFDYAFNFQRPFLYDPSRGNLLIDYRTSGCNSSPMMDFHTPSRRTAARIGIGDPGSPAGTFADYGFIVRQFTYVPAGAPFLRGDVSEDGRRSMADVVLICTEIFGLRSGTCSDAVDCNDDGSKDIRDAISLILAMFRRGPGLPDPSHGCGVDYTMDDLTCESYGACEVGERRVP